MTTLPIPVSPSLRMGMKGGADEAKELDSPQTTSTSTSVSSYDDDHSLRTPPRLPERLGRIVLSSRSSPSTLGGSSSSSEEMESASETMDCRAHRSMRRPAQVSSTQRKGNLEDLHDITAKALLDALQQLNRLASLDSAEYQQRLLENSLPVLQTDPVNPLHCPKLTGNDTDSQSSRNRLAQPIQTPLVQLSMSIHRLHATIANVTSEVDGHSDEVQELQSQLEALRKRNQTVEAAAKKVHKKNIELKNQAQHYRKMAKGLKHKIHKCEALLQSQDLELMASKVHQHEIQLQLNEAKRERLDSNMSSELITQTHIQGDEEEAAELVSLRSDLSVTSALERKEADDCTIDTSLSVESSGSRKIATEDATRTVFVSGGTHGTESNKERNEKLTNKSESVHDQKIKASLPSLSSRFAQFLGPRTASNYTLKMIPPYKLQFVELHLTGESNKGEKTSMTPVAFAVCGFEGFDSEMNMKPTLGARLIKINGETVEECWTLETLYNKLDFNGHKQRGRIKGISLTFRNDTWTAMQTKVLQAASR